MGILDHALVQDGKIVTFTRDRHGDQIPQSETAIKCKFRYITEIDKQVNREGVESFDAIIWLSPDTNINEGDIVFVDGSYWRINRIVKARRLANATVLFLKCLVKKHSLAED